jgi:hypothetical protein
MRDHPARTVDMNKHVNQRCVRLVADVLFHVREHSPGECVDCVNLVSRADICERKGDCECVDCVHLVSRAHIHLVNAKVTVNILSETRALYLVSRALLVDAMVTVTGRETNCSFERWIRHLNL